MILNCTNTRCVISRVNTRTLLYRHHEYSAISHTVVEIYLICKNTHTQQYSDKLYKQY